VDEKLFPLLFLSRQPQDWFRMTDADLVRTSHKVMGMQQSWIAPEYALVMAGSGEFAEGDYRNRKPYNAVPPRNFDYVMLADKTREHSLEAEKYEDGTLIVYSTIYRPVTDIGEITGEQAAKIFGGWDALPKIKVPDAFLEQGAFDKIVPDKKAAAAVSSVSAETPAPEADKERKPSEEMRGDILSLDAKIAACIIEEATKNKTSLAEVVRKVIDLPAVVNEQVMIRFSLSNAEYSELAERYKLSPVDHDNIRSNIVRELREFAGNKK
jgi:hypothetical protein